MKTTIISDETHLKLKEFCKTHSLKLNDWVDKLILKELEIFENEKIDHKRIYKKGE